ncbi:MAG: M48 family metallopeptidase [Gammaproteobacteria bacterium]|nr:M48 family metallopeptidase [Gammaproteobacteria bacterium]MDE2273957.1 M48 family metallopeptidase [Gammaproteobacteria bacterium]
MKEPMDMIDSPEYRWRRSIRAKQLQVRITPWQGVEVVIPTHTSRERVRAFLARQRQWIRSTWSEMRSQIADADRDLPSELKLQALGEHWQVHYRKGTAAGVRIDTAARSLTVQHIGADDSRCRATLRRWLTRRARVYLEPQALRLCAHMHVSYRRLQIRGQTSRWGSCSSNGTLSLNYKLLFLDPRLVRYLLVHELAHTHVLSHSSRFWKLVAHYEPRWRGLDRELGEAWRDVPAWVELK